MINLIIYTIIATMLLVSPLFVWADQSEPADHTKNMIASDAKVKVGTASSVMQPSMNAAPSHLTGKMDKTGRVVKPKPVSDPNRRWIMKQKDLTEKKVRPKPIKSLKWENAVQEKNCRDLDRQLTLSFDRSRFYAIQGDRCKTAQYAEAFLKASEKCQKGCPENFLQFNGYSGQVLRNMHQLKAIGTESCLGKYTPTTVKK